MESVSKGAYGRTFEQAGACGTVTVTHHSEAAWLLVRASPACDLSRIERRVRRLFDLDADSEAIERSLAQDPLLARLVQQFPGIRVPGAWDPFETAVRAVIGQVVSVKAATTLTGRLATRQGEPLAGRVGGLTHLFPTPERLAQADLSGLGLSNQKIGSIRALAGAVATGELRFTELTDLDEALERLQALPGVGPWTANYLAMRALGLGDAFPAGDLILRRAAAAGGGTLSERELYAISQRWRPYRGYAAMLLWASYSGPVANRRGAVG